MNIFVTNFSSGISSHDLERLFHTYGDVGVASVWVDREERSLRFAIVEMEDDDEGERAIEKLHRKRLSAEKFAGEQLWVEQAPEALVHMLELCGEVPKILSAHRTVVEDDEDSI